MLARAEAIGGERGRGYLQERIERLKDVWKQAQDRLDPARLRDDHVQAAATLRRAAAPRPAAARGTTSPSAMSMRETENEINLLRPPAADADFYQPLYGGAALVVRRRRRTTTADDDLPTATNSGTSR